jgi:hypothetical protein
MATTHCRVSVSYAHRRHGWSRSFSIPSTELAALDYDTLEAILEINTLKLRPIGLRVYVENPADSGNWSKVRYWKHDGSLQTTLVQAFFEQRRIAGTLTRLDVRDGSDRHAEGDTLSLRTVGSRILNRKHDDNKSSTSQKTGWFGLSRNNSMSSRAHARDRMASTDVEDEAGDGLGGIGGMGGLGIIEGDHPRPRPPPASTKVRRIRFVSGLFTGKAFGSHERLRDQ